MRSRTLPATVRSARRLGFVNLTEELERAIKDSGVTHGCAVVFCAHTTCTLIVNEDERGALEDLERRLEALVPGDVYYAHDDFERRRAPIGADVEPKNGRAHVAQMIVGGISQAIPVASGVPALGKWQRLFLLELDEPRERNIVFHVFGE